MPPNVRFSALFALRSSLQIVVAFLFFCQELHAAGIAALKDQAFHDDKSAKPLIYVKLFDQGAPFVKFQTKDGDVFIDKSKIVATVDLLEAIPDCIADEAGIGSLSGSKKIMEKFGERFPQMMPLLAERITIVSEQIEKYESGLVRFRGKWIARQEYVSITQKVDSRQHVEILEAGNGKKFSNPKLLSRSVSGIRITHDDGVSEVPWNLLSPYQRKQFGYNEERELEQYRKDERRLLSQRQTAERSGGQVVERAESDYSSVSDTSETSKTDIPNTKVETKDSYYGQLNKYGIPKTVHVRSYTRKDGTRVKSHYRSSPRR